MGTYFAAGFSGRSLVGALRAVVVLVGAGVVRPMRPSRLFGVLDAYLRWGVTVALGFAVGAVRHPDRPAIVDDSGTTTYREVDERTTRLAHALLDLGVGAGGKVAVLCRNHRGFVETVTACVKIGAHAVLLNTGLSAVQVGVVLREQDVSVVVADAEFRHLLVRAPRKVRRVVAWLDGTTRSRTLEGLIAAAPATPLPGRPPRGRMIVLTSGTTGAPKGARRPEPTGLAPAAALLSRIPLRAGDRLSVPAPLFHTWGLAALQLGLVLGATFVLRREFDPAAVVADAARHRSAALFVVPVMLQRVLEVGGRVALPDLRVIASSGSALPVPVVRRCFEEFGPVLHNLYGSTEVSWVSVAGPDELARHPGTAGTPPRGTRVAILDERGRPVPAGVPGRIFVANDMLFDGYTDGGGKEVVDGLMSTGDVGYRDADGLLFVVGRDDEMVVSGGENVHPREVEDLLAGLAGVREVAVVGVPDERFGRRLVAYVVPEEPGALDEGAVLDHVRRNLARFAVPREVVFLDALPRNATGKVLKRELR
ncbi:AMP-binding protein [Saccharothrix australiensis]|uniref:Fatty-acyl-CoA synthase n=1 Tax=Saccharothrix australiensis TaxID=2072 RepID=A0A495VWL4_9PSEU|nr:AMP-binding protein [Saccharothrix australiensis]RKT52963.1 fatty-acyl-CoA synthase [Saccharothrix australiensis]